MKTVIFLGAKSIGLACLRILHARRAALGVRIIGVLTNQRGAALRDFAEANGLPVVADLEAMLEGPDADLLISVQYHRILKPRHLAKARELAVNLHMAPLPEYRGCNQFSFAILNGDAEFGTSLHVMEPGVDDGDVLAQRRFPIPAGCFVKPLYDRTEAESVALFEEALADLVAGRLRRTAQADLPAQRREFHLRREINDIKRIDLSWPAEKIARHLRATSMPGFPPPYAEIDGLRVGLVVEEG